MADNVLEGIIAKIEQKNPVHGKKLRKNLQVGDLNYIQTATGFLNKYTKYLKSIGRDFDYAIDCYLKLVSDMVVEQARFFETGEYSNKSFEDVYRRVYSDPEVMTYHMEGLLLSQVLWQHHYKMLSFFAEHLPQFKNSIKNYLEIGGGHGSFVSEALQILDGDASFVVVDISKTSLDMAKKFIASERVNFVLQDIFCFRPTQTYDCIVMGEILEHVEHPQDLLRLANKLLSPAGIAFLTVPANAPAIDHIYLFRSEQEIKDIVVRSGFEILYEASAYAENIPKEKAQKFKSPFLFGAFIKKPSDW